MAVGGVLLPVVLRDTPLLIVVLQDNSVSKSYCSFLKLFQCLCNMGVPKVWSFRTLHILHTDDISKESMLYYHFYNLSRNNSV
jgi:hypothetical protein